MTVRVGIAARAMGTQLARVTLVLCTSLASAASATAQTGATVDPTEASLRRSITACAAEHTDDHLPLLELRLELARHLARNGKPAEARSLLEALRATTGAVLADRARIARSARLELAVMDAQGPDSARALQELQGLVDELRAEDDRSDLYWLAVQALAIGRKSRNDYQGALTLEREFLARAEQTLQPDDYTLQGARINLAWTLAELFAYDEAIGLLELAVDALRRTRSADDDGLLIAQGNLSILWRLTGSLGRALAADETILRARLQKHPPDHPRVQLARMNLAVSKKLAGDFDGALALERQILDVRRGYPSDHPELLAIQENLANTLLSLGQFDEALQLVAKAYEARKRLPETNPKRTECGKLMGAILGETGRFEEALPLLADNLRQMERILPEGHPVLEEDRGNLAQVLADLGRYDEALPLARDTLRSFETTLGESHPLLHQARINLAGIHLLRGERELARPLIAQAVGDTARLNRSLLDTSAVLTGADRRTGLRLIGMLLALDRDDDNITHAREDLRQLLVLRSATAIRARTARRLRELAERDPTVTAALQRALSLRAQWTRTLHSTSPAERANLQEQYVAFRNAESALAERVARVAGAPEPIDLDWITRRLGASSRAILVQSFTLLRTTRDRDQNRTQVACFVLGSDGGVARFDLGDRGALAAGAARMRARLTAQIRAPRGAPGRDPEPVAGNEGDPLPALQPLISALPKDADRLVILPDGPLAAIPWSELRRADGTLLGQRCAIRYLPDLDGSPPVKVVEPSLLVVGDVAFGQAEDGATPWPALPASATEIASVEHAFRTAFPDAGVTALTAAAATVSQFSANAPGKRFVHLATHAFADVSGKLRHENLQPGVTEAADLSLRAGIVFANANAAGPEACMTALGLSELDLGDCELAVLSACDTNVGPRYQGEAVAGVNRALMLAGARSSITTLWRVDDEGAAAFFERFYKKLWADSHAPLDVLLQSCTEELRAAGWGPGVHSAFVYYASDLAAR